MYYSQTQKCIEDTSSTTTITSNSNENLKAPLTKKQLVIHETSRIKSTKTQSMHSSSSSTLCNRTEQQLQREVHQRCARTASNLSNLCRSTKNRWLQRSKLSTHLLLHQLLDTLWIIHYIILCVWIFIPDSKVINFLLYAYKCYQVECIARFKGNKVTFLKYILSTGMDSFIGGICDKSYF